MSNKDYQFKGTKGEWRFCNVPQTATLKISKNFLAVDNGTECVMLLGNPDVDGKVMHNAHLIATAPDLLEACKEVLEDMDAIYNDEKKYPDSNTMWKLKSAVHKALNIQP